MAAMRARPEDLKRLYTVEEFEQLPEFGDRYELIDGKLVEKPVPGYEHSRIAKIIIRRLTLFDPDETLGELLPSPSVYISRHLSPIPDLAFLVAARIPISGNPHWKKALRVIPDLVVEVWSPSDIDTVAGLEAARQKMQIWLDARVLIGWGIKPDDQTVEVYRAGRPVERLTINDQLTGEDVIPNFTIPVRVLFE